MEGRVEGGRDRIAASFFSTFACCQSWGLYHRDVQKTLEHAVFTRFPPSGNGQRPPVEAASLSAQADSAASDGKFSLALDNVSNAAPIYENASASKTKLMSPIYENVFDVTQAAAPVDGRNATPENRIGDALRDLASRWRIAVVTERPKADDDRPAIWESKRRPGYIGVQVPGYKPRYANRPAKAEAFFERAGIERTGIVSPTRLSDGSRIRVDGTSFPPAERSALERKYAIHITPLLIGGREIAYLFAGSAQPNRTVLISCHGKGTSGSTFTKPPNIEFRFASPRNTILRSATPTFMAMMMEGQVTVLDESQIYTGVREAVNYSLSGGIRTTPAVAALLIAEVVENGTEPFDLILLNRNAKGVRFADVIQSLRDTLRYEPDKIVCHFCRPQDDAAVQFTPRSGYL